MLTEASSTQSFISSTELQETAAHAYELQRYLQKNQQSTAASAVQQLGQALTAAAEQMPATAQGASRNGRVDESDDLDIAAASIKLSEAASCHVETPPPSPVEHVATCGVDEHSDVQTLGVDWADTGGIDSVGEEVLETNREEVLDEAEIPVARPRTVEFEPYALNGDAILDAGELVQDYYEEIENEHLLKSMTISPPAAELGRLSSHRRSEPAESFAIQQAKQRGHRLSSGGFVPAVLRAVVEQFVESVRGGMWITVKAQP